MLINTQRLCLPPERYSPSVNGAHIGLLVTVSCHYYWCFVADHPFILFIPVVGSFRCLNFSAVTQSYP